MLFTCHHVWSDHQRSGKVERVLSDPDHRQASVGQTLDDMLLISWMGELMLPFPPLVKMESSALSWFSLGGIWCKKNYCLFRMAIILDRRLTCSF